MIGYAIYLPFFAMIVTGIHLLIGVRKGGILTKYYRRGLKENKEGIKYSFQAIKKYVQEKWKRMNKKRRIETMDKEIYDAISFLRNIISIERGKQVSTDFIIEQLSEREGLLQPVYIKMLSLLRLNKKKEAAGVMSEELQTPNGKEFASLLLKWDEINPQELTEILLSHQKSIKEFRITAQKHKDEVVSDLIYFPVVMNVVFIFINFIYVGYFISQKEILQTIL
ncbi:hypothetical protein [Clostridium aminobutyricum]|uniref:Uncharacterized protein n=1 Tax=Clostridium aminobutyricum TaxID=33953 RepID=A0A939D5Y0_CLOAM|nr:hypothetical protein [Clostridium aminobutyricum]MBN7772059.1 hypothetical protein [Clostridium aminobutyricum]